MSALADRFDPVADWLGRAAAAGERLDLAWAADASDFVRFNHGRVRQAGSVQQIGADLRLVRDGRSVRGSVTLPGNAADDCARLDALLAELRGAMADAEPDPFLLLDDSPERTTTIEPAQLPSPDELVDTVRSALHDEDLVGFYMGGPMARGLVTSLGHRHLHESASWSFDFSVYAPRPELRDKAVKSSVAGQAWDPDALRRAVREAAQRVPLLLRPARTLPRGRHRALLSPQAAAELVGMLGWGGLSARAHLTGESPLARLRHGHARFDDRFTLVEDLAGARVPCWQTEGFRRPASLTLIERGRFANWLASPRSAREFGIDSNAADPSESPSALSVAPGDLPDDAALARLDTGLAISNLWYLNHSDREACRVTGMTRFATLWVEDGVPVAPVEVMRFDDSLYELFGPQLLALGATAHWLPDTSSYGWRAFGGIRCPAVLVAGMSFTL